MTQIGLRFCRTKLRQGDMIANANGRTRGRRPDRGKRWYFRWYKNQ
jgi:hypothetical protein